MIVQLLTAVIVLALLGVAVYVIEKLIPMPPPFQVAIRALVGIGFLLWLLHLLSGWPV